MRNKLGHKKKSGEFQWLHISIQILFNEKAPKMHIFCATRIGVTCFFNIVAPKGGHNLFYHQIGGSQKYFRGTFGNSWPLFPKKMVAPLLGFMYTAYWNTTDHWEIQCFPGKKDRVCKMCLVIKYIKHFTCRHHLHFAKSTEKQFVYVDHIDFVLRF